MIYLMSDLAVDSSAVPRLAKLVLMCLLSEEVRQELCRKYIEDFHYIGTSAFSRHPVSMKYRGVFKKHTRKETVDGYMLNYYAAFTGKSLPKSLAAWKKKYGT